MNVPSSIVLLPKITVRALFLLYAVLDSYNCMQLKAGQLA